MDLLAIETQLNKEEFKADRSQLRSFADLVIKCGEHGLFLEDIGGDNLSIRDDTIVIRDFGKGVIQKPPKSNPYYDYYCDYCDYEIEWCDWCDLDCCECSPCDCCW